MFDCIIFDIDGTLLDTKKASTLSAQKTLLDMTGSEPPPAELDALFGIPNDFIAQKYGVDKKTYSDIVDRYYEHYGAKYNSVFPFVVETLEKLSGMPLILGIITAKSRWEYEHDFGRFKLKSFFNEAVTASDAAPKPSREPVDVFIKKTGAVRERILFLGDAATDYECARASGIAFAFANWSGNTAIKGSDYILDDIRNLPDII